MSYKRVVLKAFGGIDQLKLETAEILPEPAKGEVRVKVLTAGTGFTDTIIRKGQYIGGGLKEKPPFVLGYDWFGVVDKVGPSVTGLSVGQHVADMSVIGGYTQYLCVDADRAIPAPEGLDPARAVAMILSYTTAYQLLTRIRKLKRGSTCLVHAAGGAVGTAVLDVARGMDIKVYGTCSAPKHPLVEKFGGIPIDYKNEDFVERILKETGGEGVDIVLDTLGAANWKRSYRCVKKGGVLVGYGAQQVTQGEESMPALMFGLFKLLALWKLIPDGRSTDFFNIQARRQKLPQEFKEDVQTLFGMLANGKVEPAIEDVVPLDQFAEVHRKIDNAEIAGKIVLECS